MNTKTKKEAPSEQNPAIKPCIFTPAERKRLKPLLSKDSFDQLMELVAGDPMPTPLVDSNNEKCDDFTMDRLAINSWCDGGHQYIYQLGRRVYAFYEGFDESFVSEEDDVRDVIDYFVSKYGGCLEECCVGFGVKPDLCFAKRGCNGLCRVWINTFYRDSHSRTGDCSRWVRDDDDNEIILFDSYSEARKWINQDKKNYYTNGMYKFNNNEYDYRQYKICK